VKRQNPISTFFHSIRFRLVVWFTFILALVLMAFSAFVFFNQARDVRGDALYRLTRTMAGVEQAFAKTDNDFTIALQESDIFVLAADDGHFITTYGIASGQDLIDLGKKAQEANAFWKKHPEGPFPAWVQELHSPRAHYFFISKVIFDKNQHAALAILGSPFDPYDLSGRLLITLMIGSGLTLAIAIGGGLWLADRAMRPVHTITQAARTISETDLSRRLNLKTRDELGELASTFDDMLARLQAAFERQRQFVADASHELRTPLTIVNLEASRALAAARSRREYERALKVIQSENDFMSRLVNDLLTLARMDSGQMSMEKKPVDLSDIALEAVERLSSLAERRRVKLEVGELPEARISGDRQYLLQMVSNLIENGIKYTSGDDRRVKVETGAGAESAWIRVSDNGIGIPEEHLPHLFERFYRVDKARQRDDEDQPTGSGLGLSIVHWIARAHGGETLVESRAGKGTTIEVKFNSRKG
jgi:signal transduction histidine kinase